MVKKIIGWLCLSVTIGPLIGTIFYYTFLVRPWDEVLETFSFVFLFVAILFTGIYLAFED